MTENELLEALRAALDEARAADDVDGLSARQIRKLLGLGRSTVNELLTDLIDSGVLEALRARGTDIAGRPCQVVRYRLKG